MGDLSKRRGCGIFEQEKGSGRLNNIQSRTMVQLYTLHTCTHLASHTGIFKNVLHPSRCTFQHV